MEKKTVQQTLCQIYNETLESLLKERVNHKLYESILDDEHIIPEELVEAGVRRQKTAGQRRKEIAEVIDKQEQALEVIEKMINEL